MNIFKKFFICFCVIALSACATKDYSPESLKNYTAKQILYSGEKALSDGHYKDAIKYFEALDALYPFDPESQQGELDVIYAYYKADDNASALAAADRYIHLHPVDRHTAYVYYMRGIVNFGKDRTWLQKLHPKNPEELDLTNLQAAFNDFDTLIKSFPKSKYVPDAHKRMLHIRDLLAKRELQIAQFYFERKVYVAAANRASYIVQHLNGAPQVVAALKIMIKSYRALGADKQARDALRILQTNFPKERV